jgi:hypothetical protein
MPQEGRCPRVRGHAASSGSSSGWGCGARPVDVAQEGDPRPARELGRVPRADDAGLGRLWLPGSLEVEAGDALAGHRLRRRAARSIRASKRRASNIRHGTLAVGERQTTDTLPAHRLPLRLVVGQRTLDPLGEVRILEGQPPSSRPLELPRRGRQYAPMAQSPGRTTRGDVVKWLNTEVCKTSIQRFESARRLH